MYNLIRLKAARTGLMSAAWSRGDSPRCDEGSLTDLLVDLRHLCAATGLDFDRCDRVAAMHFDGEHGGAS